MQDIVKYEAIAQNHARLIKEGKRKLEDVKNLFVRNRVKAILASQ